MSNRAAKIENQMTGRISDKIQTYHCQARVAGERGDEIHEVNVLGCSLMGAYDTVALVMANRMEKAVEELYMEVDFIPKKPELSLVSG